MPKADIDFTKLANAGYVPRKRKAGEVLFSEGDAGDCMYILRSGQVGLQRGGKTIETVGPGGIFGEMSLIDGSPRSAAARAMTDCELLEIDEKTFVFLVHETPYFALDVMRTLAARIRSMNDLI